MNFCQCNYANEKPSTQSICKRFTLVQLMSVPKRDELGPFGDLQFVWDFRSHLKCLGMRKFSHISEKLYAGGFETSYIFITTTQSCSLAHSQQWVWVPVSHSIPWSSCGTCPLVWIPQFLLLNWLWYTWQHPKMTAWVQTNQGRHCCSPMITGRQGNIFLLSACIHPTLCTRSLQTHYSTKKQTVKYFKVVFLSRRNS